VPPSLPPLLLPDPELLPLLDTVPPLDPEPLPLLDTVPPLDPEPPPLLEPVPPLDPEPLPPLDPELPPEPSLVVPSGLAASLLPRTTPSLPTMPLHAAKAATARDTPASFPQRRGRPATPESSGSSIPTKPITPRRPSFGAPRLMTYIPIALPKNSVTTTAG
jgi:hypothetical protein